VKVRRIAGNVVRRSAGCSKVDLTQPKFARCGNGLFRIGTMAHHHGNRPAEIFGFPVTNRSSEADEARRTHWCPFQGKRCTKASRLLDYPFGVCSVEHHGVVGFICPHRFKEPGTIGSVPRVLQDIAAHYFGSPSIDHLEVFSEVGLPGIGTIDYVMTSVRRGPFAGQVEDFVPVEIQSDQTTGTGGLVLSMRDYMDGRDVQLHSYPFGMNTYDTIKRSVTQLFNKGLVYEAWGTKSYWVIQEYIYRNLVVRYGLKIDGFSSMDASRFALYDILPIDGRLTLTPTRILSTSVDELFQAMRDNPLAPSKDRFFELLNRRLQARRRAQLTAGMFRD
jgi:hypothetical protein